MGDHLKSLLKMKSSLERIIETAVAWNHHALAEQLDNILKESGLSSLINERRATQSSLSD